MGKLRFFEVEKRNLSDVVGGLLFKYGINSEDVLFRVFHGDRVGQCLKNGTDRDDNSASRREGVSARNQIHVAKFDYLPSIVRQFGDYCKSHGIISRIFGYHNTFGVSVYNKEDLDFLGDNCDKCFYKREDGVVPKFIFRVKAD